MTASRLSAPARREMPGLAVIAAAGHAYPSLTIDNDAYLARCRFTLDQDPGALARETRMVTRRWCAPDENAWTLVRRAVDDALTENPALRDEIDVVVAASATTMPGFHPADPSVPGMADLAPLVIRHIGRDGALGVDLKAVACTGFLRGMQVADALLANANYRAALVVAGEHTSRFAVAESNKSTFCFVLGDAAGAMILRKEERRAGAGLVDYVGHTEGSKSDWVIMGPDLASLFMGGGRAAESTVGMMVDCGRTLLARNGLTAADVRWLLPIQTHVGIVTGVRKALEWPADKVLWRGDVTGFSGSASIPACFAEERRRGTIRRGELVLALAVGAGMNCAGALFHA